MRTKKAYAIFMLLPLILAASCGRHTGGPGSGLSAVEDIVSEDSEYDDIGTLDFNEADQGGVLNICCTDEEGRRIFTEYYPGYEQTDAASGRIGNTIVNWTSVPSGDDTEDMDEATDIFIVSAGEAVELVQSKTAMPLSELGIREKTLEEQFAYTKQIVTDSEGVIRGTSWECCPAVLYYNRDIAIEIFGSDEPEDVWDYVKTWEAFGKTAGIMRAAGYRMTASAGDIFVPYAQMASGPWVENGTLNVDTAYSDWAEAAMGMVSMGQASFAERFTSAWEAGFKSPGTVFCYPASWSTVRPYMHEEEEGYVANEGRWAVTSAPTDFFDGGSFLLASQYTDNPALAANIMRRLSLDRTIMRKMAEDEDMLVNNRALMEKAASNERPVSALGGQSPLSLYIEVADRINLPQTSLYDYECTTEFVGAMQNYFEGNANFDESFELFKTTIVERFPELNADQAADEDEEDEYNDDKEEDQEE